MFEVSRTEDIILGCAAFVRRNYAGMPFYHKLSQEQKDELKCRVQNALSAAEGSLASRVDAPEDIAHRFFAEAFCSAKADTVLLLSGETEITVFLGASDQMNLGAFARGNDASKALSACQNAESLLSAAGEFAFDKNMGYLTSSVRHTGNAAQIGYLVHLQGLGRLDKIEELNKELQGKGFQLVHLFTEDDMSAEFFCFTTRVNLGKTVSQVIAGAEETLSELVIREREAREELIYEDVDRFADDVLRAMGVALYARLMSYSELMDIYGDVRAGLTGGFLTGSYPDLDDFVFSLSPRCLEEEFGGISERDEHLIRADRVRRKFGESITIKNI